MSEVLPTALFDERRLPEYEYGSRYWSYSRGGLLASPYARTYYSNPDQWRPGINTYHCSRGSHNDARDPRAAWLKCRCGLYCFGHDADVTRTPYYDMVDGSFYHFASGRRERRPDGIVGGVAHWNSARSDVAGEISYLRAEYLAIAALVRPRTADARKDAQLAEAAERYGVAVVAAEELADAVDEWIRRRAPLESPANA